MNVTLRHHTALSLLCGVLLLLASSCHHDGPAPAPTEDNAQVRLVLRVPEIQGDDYENGTTYENHIDFMAGDYRIYFFDTDENFITRLETSSLIPVAGTDYTEYQITGKIARILVENQSFKVVVLANWGKYDGIDENIGKEEEGKGINTITELCNHSAAQYTYKTDFFPKENNNDRIPFFGMHTFTGVTFAQDPRDITNLSGDIWLLRAMAKVEVILDQPEHSLTSVSISHYNKTGYCTPMWGTEWTFPESGLEWTFKDMPLHLVGDANNPAMGPENKGLTFTKLDGDNNHWVIYLPEYQNVDDGVTPAHIDVTFNNDRAEKIYFIDYPNNAPIAEDPTPTMDINRNTIYRFNIRIHKDIPIEVNTTTMEWTRGEGEVTFDFTPGMEDENDIKDVTTNNGN